MSNFRKGNPLRTQRGLQYSTFGNISSSTPPLSYYELMEIRAAGNYVTGISSPVITANGQANVFSVVAVNTMSGGFSFGQLNFPNKMPSTSVALHNSALSTGVPTSVAYAFTACADDTTGSNKCYARASGGIEAILYSAGSGGLNNSKSITESGNACSFNGLTVLGGKLYVSFKRNTINGIVELNNDISAITNNKNITTSSALVRNITNDRTNLYTIGYDIVNSYPVIMKWNTSLSVLVQKIGNVALGQDIKSITSDGGNVYVLIRSSSTKDYILKFDSSLNLVAEINITHSAEYISASSTAGKDLIWVGNGLIYTYTASSSQRQHFILLDAALNKIKEIRGVRSGISDYRGNALSYRSGDEFFTFGAVSGEQYSTAITVQAIDRQLQGAFITTTTDATIATSTDFSFSTSTYNMTTTSSLTLVNNTATTGGASPSNPVNYVVQYGKTSTSKLI